MQILPPQSTQNVECKNTNKNPNPPPSYILCNKYMNTLLSTWCYNKQCSMYTIPSNKHPNSLKQQQDPRRSSS